MPCQAVKGRKRCQVLKQLPFIPNLVEQCRIMHLRYQSGIGGNKGKGIGGSALLLGA